MAGLAVAVRRRHRVRHHGGAALRGKRRIALLANTAATVAALAVLIAILGPISGGHFNPAVTMVMAIRGDIHAGVALAYACSQIAGALCGAVLAHAMFEMPLFQDATRVRAGPAQWLAEFVATTGLIVVVLASSTVREAAWRIPAWIGAAYWFTASTSFANPAITAGRAITDTFTGIRLADVPGFLAGQLIGACVGFAIARLLFAGRNQLASNEPANQSIGVAQRPETTESPP